MRSPSSNLLTPEEVATRLDVTPRTIQRWALSEKCPGDAIGVYHEDGPDAVEAWLVANPDWVEKWWKK